MVNVEAAPGRGWLAHRAGALLWSPDEARPDALLAAFLGARDAESTRDAVTAAVIDADLDVAAFALVTWAPHLHVVVMGAVDVETDAPSLPLLSGATSRTWVEHGVPGVSGRRRRGVGRALRTTGLPSAPASYAREASA